MEGGHQTEIQLETERKGYRREGEEKNETCIHNSENFREVKREGGARERDRERDRYRQKARGSERERQSETERGRPNPVGEEDTTL